MITVVAYVTGAFAIAALFFLLFSFVFGRGEILPPLPADSTPTTLPVSSLSGEDIRGLRFRMRFRGYDMAAVDWALEKTAREIDQLREELDRKSAEQDFAVETQDRAQ